ncbi:hypothetical protein V2G26_003564 [Clonostachys chloroleuca]
MSVDSRLYRIKNGKQAPWDATDACKVLQSKSTLAMTPDRTIVGLVVEEFEPRQQPPINTISTTPVLPRRSPFPGYPSFYLKFKRVGAFSLASSTYCGRFHYLSEFG